MLLSERARFAGGGASSTAAGAAAAAAAPASSAARPSRRGSHLHSTQQQQQQQERRRRQLRCNGSSSSSGGAVFGAAAAASSAPPPPPPLRRLLRGAPSPAAAAAPAHQAAPARHRLVGGGAAAAAAAAGGGAPSSSRRCPPSLPSSPPPPPRGAAAVARASPQPIPSSALASIDAGMSSGELVVSFDNGADAECTVLTVEGKDRSDLLMSLTGALTASDVAVVSASIASDDGRVLDVFRCTTLDGLKVPESRWDALRGTILALTTASSRSGVPAIYGVVAAAEVERLRRPGGGRAAAGAEEAAGAANNAAELELAAAELASAAANIVAIERDLSAMLRRAAGAAKDAGANGAAAAAALSLAPFDAAAYDAREAERAEAAAVLERRMAAMEAALAARRTSPLLDVLRIPAAAQAEAPPASRPESKPGGAKESLREQLRRQLEAPAPPPPGTGPAAGNGFELLLQGFNWESHRGKNWYREVASRADEWAEAGFTCVWMPPPSDAVSAQGYLPRDLYDLDSCYGTEAELRDCITALHDAGIKVLADIVINHRCAHHQSPDGKWNRFGGRLAWDARAICNNNPAWGGKGNHKTGDDYPAAPNIDHTQEFVREDVSQWLSYLRNSIGFDGWRFDYVRGYGGGYAKQYVDATVPEMAIGEYWDACDYTDGVLNYNQDAHRQRTINWCDATGGTCAAFDFTTKGVLQEALGRSELWRLVDAQGRPPGVLGMWPSRAITFLDNHDTGSTLNHWPFPSHHLPEGYAYILTHPGTPTVFYDHLYTEAHGLRKAILDLVALRRRRGLSCRSTVVVRKAAGDVYAATLDDRCALKIGRGDWSPGKGKVDPPAGTSWRVTVSGNNWAVWEALAPDESVPS